MTGIGIEIAGVPKAVHGAFILGSPVDARPRGAGPAPAPVLDAAPEASGQIRSPDSGRYQCVLRRSDRTGTQDENTQIQSLTPHICAGLPAFRILLLPRVCSSTCGDPPT